MVKILLKFTFLSFLVFVCTSFLGKFVLEERRGHQTWRDFYELPDNSLDIVFMGSSLSYSSFNPLIFNGKLNLNTYNLGTASQDIKQVYYNLIEVLEYQTPKMIIVEAYSLDIIDKSEEDRLGFLFENLDYQKMSFRKLNFINNQFCSLKNKINAISPLVRNHDKWKEVDFIQENIERVHKRNRLLGYKLQKRKIKSKVLKTAITKAPNEYILSEENEVYFKKIVSLCEEKNIELLMVRAPVLLAKYKENYYKKIFDNVKKLCENNDVDYIDYNQMFDELLLDESCFFDAIHLNYKGAVKLSEAFSSYLTKYNTDNQHEINILEPEYFIYSEDLYNNKGKILFEGDFLIDEDLYIKQVKVFNTNKDDYSIIVKMNKGLNYDKISNFGLGYYFYPIDNQVSLLETEKDLKRKYTSIGDHSVPMSNGDNYFIALRSYNLKPNTFKKIKIEFNNKEKKEIKYLTINDVKFNRQK